MEAYGFILMSETPRVYARGFLRRRVIHTVLTVNLEFT